MTLAAACCPLLSLQQAVSTCKTQLVQLSSKKFCTLTLPVRSGSNKANVSFLVCDGCNIQTFRSRVLWLPRKVGVVRWRWCLESWNASHHLLGTLSGQRWAAQNHDYLTGPSKICVFLQPFSCISVESPPLLPPTQNKLTKQKNQHQLSIQTGFRSASRPQRQQLWWMAGSIWETPTCSLSKRGSSQKNAHVYHCLSISWTKRWSSLEARATLEWWRNFQAWHGMDEERQYELN